MTCKDCMHCEMCYVVRNIGYKFTMVELHCTDFKDKSKYIELPCKVGDTVYSVCRKGGKPYIKEEIVKSIYCDVRETLNFVVLNPNNKILKSNLFFTKSEAEQKLKELQE